MRTMIALVAALGVLTTTSCRQSSTPVREKGSGISAVGIFGAVHVHVTPTACAGRATLSQGAAEVKDSCFTGDTNIVPCTDVTNASPVRCAPSAGSLLVGGSASDVIAYARMR